ncbi:MAG: hypothetical protein VKN13_02815 [Cyanobacteriota bacterium]|nr:hypothetical protein [Cyanobacteriota bacterium]
MTSLQRLDDDRCERLNGGGRLITINNTLNVAVPTNVAAPTQVGVIALSRDVVLNQTSRIRQRNLA